MKTFLLIIATSISLFSCTSIKKTEDNLHRVSYNDFGEITKLKGHIFELDSVWKPERIYSIDSLICLTDRTCDYIVQIFSKKNKTLIGKNIPYGIGPNEKLSCWTMQITGNKVYTFDLQVCDLSEFDKNDFFSKNGIYHKTAITINGATDILALNNGKFVAFEFDNEDSWLSLFDSTGVRENVYVDFPKIDIDQSLTKFQTRQFFETRLYYNSKNDRIFVTYPYTDLFEIYDSNLKRLHCIYGPEQFPPNLVIKSNRIGITDNTKFSSVCSCMTDNYIWVLYYGTNDPTNADKVLVFDYQGNPHIIYQLDFPIHGIAVDETEKAIYGIADNPERCIMVFNYE